MEEEDSRDMRIVLESLRDRVKYLKEENRLLKKRKQDLEELTAAFEQVNRNLT